MILDIHTHKAPPYPEGIISLSPDKLSTETDFPGQLYSIGYHPWEIPFAGISPEQLAMLKKEAQRPDVVAIGETGIDMAKEGIAPLFAQMNTFKAHVDVSEAMELPLIIHCVKAHDIIIDMRKELKPAQRWIIHGFRGKPTILKMFLDAGIDISYGEKFNPDSVAFTPPDRMFAETDESPLPISDIIDSIKLLNLQFNPEVNQLFNP